MRDSFVFYKSFLDALSCFPDKVQLQLFRAITSYALDDVDPDLTGAAKGVWALIKPQIDVNNIRYLNGCKGGRKKGQGKGNQNARKKPLKTEQKLSEKSQETNQKQTKNELTDSFQNKPKTNQKQTKNEPNVNVNVNVNVNEKENVKEKSVCKKETIHTHTQPDIFPNPDNHEQRLIQSMRNAPMWQEDVCRCYKITQTQLQKHIEQFSAECRAKQTTHQNDRDIRSHFVDWLRYQLNKNQNGRKTTETNPRADYQETLTNAIANFANGDT